jgi:hypothetical protein
MAAHYCSELAMIVRAKSHSFKGQPTGNLPAYAIKMPKGPAFVAECPLTSTDNRM